MLLLFRLLNVWSWWVLRQLFVHVWDSPWEHTHSAWSLYGSWNQVFKARLEFDLNLIAAWPIWKLIICLGPAPLPLFRLNILVSQLLTVSRERVSRKGSIWLGARGSSIRLFILLFLCGGICFSCHSSLPHSLLLLTQTFTTNYITLL